MFSLPFRSFNRSCRTESDEFCQCCRLLCRLRTDYRERVSRLRGGKKSDRDRWRFHHLLPDTHGDHLGWSVRSINVDLVDRQQLYQGNEGQPLDAWGVILSALEIVAEKKLHDGKKLLHSCRVAVRYDLTLK